MDVAERITAILNDGQLHSDPACEPSKCAVILAAIGEFGWEPVRACLLGVLRDDARSAHWRDVAHALWEAVLDRRPLPIDEVIALLYHRFDPDCRGQPRLEHHQQAEGPQLPLRLQPLPGPRDRP